MKDMLQYIQNYLKMWGKGPHHSLSVQMLSYLPPPPPLSNLYEKGDGRQVAYHQQTEGGGVSPSTISSKQFLM